MERRRFLTSLTAITATAGLAGCSGILDEDNEENDENGDNAGGNGNESENGQDDTDAQAEERYNEAIDFLVANQEQLDTLESEDAERDSKDLEEMRDRLADAEVALDDAETHSDDDFLEQVEAARDVADFQALLVDSHEHDLDIDEALDAADAFFDTDQLERATQEYESVTAMVGDARSFLGDLETAYAELDTEPIDEPTLSYDGEVSDYIRLDARSDLDIIESFAAAMAETSRGFQQMFDGIEEYEVETYAVAEDSFESARDVFESAHTTFENLQDRDDLPTGIRGSFIELAALTDTAGESIALYADATRAAQNGNMEEAEALFREGNSVLEDAT